MITIMIWYFIGVITAYIEIALHNDLHNDNKPYPFCFFSWICVLIVILEFTNRHEFHKPSLKAFINIFKRKQ